MHSTFLQRHACLLQRTKAKFNSHFPSPASPSSPPLSSHSHQEPAHELMPLMDLKRTSSASHLPFPGQQQGPSAVWEAQSRNAEDFPLEAKNRNLLE
jgi:hypothetical protein